MTSNLKILIVDDNEQDAALVIRTLAKGGIQVESRRVETEVEMREQLLSKSWDVVICDFTMPKFSALSALRTMRKLGLDLPFIIVSGTIEEDAAVEAIRAGAHDFVSKGKFARLIPAIEREIREAHVRAESAKMRQQLLISDRMASIGTLAAGVAHEANNPLTAVIGGLELAVEDLDEIVSAGQKRQAKTEEETLHLATLKQTLDVLIDALDAAERVRLIVRDLKAFSRSDDETTGPVNIERAIDASIRMVQNEVRHHAGLTTRYGSVPLVRGNEARLGQVFLNLIVNAAQAMSGTRFEDNEIVIVTDQASDGRVLVEVRDNGPGIPQELLGRIFDPFFTTKPIGTGTGLGLTICHRIISELGGEIQVESSPGCGTTFRTLLPLYIPSPQQEPTAAPQSVRRRGARILVIDDEPVVGQLIARMAAGDYDVTAV
ncbi:MAG TPA: ATP-binding protein, partial [Polyangiaceae bacterium]|nr:ATP-binding protein [Polyangiaceae bacterium]